jgi:tetratricopeptide (TPR) repeat protein
LHLLHGSVHRNEKQTELIPPLLPGNIMTLLISSRMHIQKQKKLIKIHRTELVFMIAECYRLTNDPKNAETWYKLAVKSSYSKPEAQFWLAESMKKNGKYPLAIDEFKKYKQIAPSDARAEQEIRSCELSVDWLRNPEAYKIDELKDLNSKEADFSPAYGRDDFGLIYFTSSRDGVTG